MTPDLTALILAALLWAGGSLRIWPSAPTLKSAAAISCPRATPRRRKELSQSTQRLKRAYENHLEALVLFAIAVTAITLTGKESTLTTILAFTYLGARVLFIPAYALGWTPWRSVFFGIGYLCSMLLLALALISVLHLCPNILGG